MRFLLMTLVTLPLSLATAPDVIEYTPSALTLLPLALEGYPNSSCETEATRGYACDEGWRALGQGSEDGVCVKYHSDSRDFFQARSTCLSQNSSILSERHLQLWQPAVRKYLKEESLDVWIDSERQDRYGSCKRIDNGEAPSSRSCSYSLRFVCLRKAACKPNRVGAHCQHECHCLSGLCQGLPCPGGCQAGWRGPYCCLKEAPAAVAYYCVDTGAERYLQLRLDPKVVRYEVLEPVDGAGRPGAWCHNVSLSRDPRDFVYTLTVPVQDEGAACARQKTGNNTYTWTLSLKEAQGLRRSFDRTLQITCDFDEAETLSRDLQFTLPLSQKKPVEVLQPTREDVQLQVVDPVTNDVIQVAKLGRMVVLRMRLTIEGKLTAVGVSPYNCQASPPDGSYTRPLTDSAGCPVSTDVMSSLRGSGGRVTSQAFPLFAFPGQNTVTISCRFQFCFTKSEQPLCDDRCAATQSGRKKRAAGDQGDAVSTSVLILPDVGSGPANRPSAPRYAHASKNNGGHDRPASSGMMTPVTWFLLAVLLVMSGALVYTLYSCTGRRGAVRVRQIRG